MREREGERERELSGTNPPTPSAVQHPQWVSKIIFIAAAVKSSNVCGGGSGGNTKNSISQLTI